MVDIIFSGIISGIVEALCLLFFIRHRMLPMIGIIKYKTQDKED